MEKPIIQINAADPKQPLIIHMLEGKAPEPAKTLHPQQVIITGNIDSVAEYLKLRLDTVDKNKAVVVFNEEDRTITLEADPSSEIGTLVKGYLELYPKLEAFGINKGKIYTHKELESFLKMNRIYFSSKEENISLVANLGKFKAKVDVAFTDESDNRGNKNRSLIKTVNSDVPLDFRLNMPIFKGTPRIEFKVEICYDVNDAGPRFWLESVELAESQELALHTEFQKAYNIISQMDLTIIYQ